VIEFGGLSPSRGPAASETHDSRVPEERINRKIQCGIRQFREGLGKWAPARLPAFEQAQLRTRVGAFEIDDLEA